MTNEQLALLLDPRREKPGWWVQQQKRVCRKCGSDTKIVGLARICASMSCLSDSLKSVPHGDPIYTGPDYHASDDACFRDWRPVLLAAGWLITEALSGTSIQDDVGVTMEMEETYRAAILAAVAWLNEHKPELLREAIARVNKGE